jgi:hypothetical protein
VREDGSLVVRAEQIDRMPRALPGTWVKLPDCNRNHSRFAFLLKVDPDAPEVTHQHIGAAGACVLQGGFSCDKDGSPAGIIDVDWMVEQAKAHGAFGHLEKAVRG